MKAGREHRVPLSQRATDILDAAQTLDGQGFVFPGVRGTPLSDMICSKLLRKLQVGAVPHGFRSSFRDWAAEQTNHPREVVEAALAHVVQNKVEAAYARSDLFERRQQLMDDYMDASQRQGQLGVHGRADCSSISGLCVASAQCGL